MILLFCNTVYAFIVVAVVFLAACVIWHEWAKIRPFAIACLDCGGSGSAEDCGGFAGEDCPRCWGSGEEPGDTGEWDRGHDEWVDRQTGVA